MSAQPWFMFKCNNPNCRWQTPGCYNFENDPRFVGCLPDTDCPKCKFHDSVHEGVECGVPDDAHIKHIQKTLADGASYPEAL
jgi:hypothetical protein